MTAAAAEEQPVDRMDALALEMRAGFAEVRAGFAEMRASQAEIRASFAEVRAELAEFRSWTNERFATLIDAVADLRNDLHGHTHGG